MDMARKLILQKNREALVEDIEVNHVIDDLFCRLVISSEEREKITLQSERKFRVRCMLDIISQKGNEEYEHFVEVLTKDYDWLAKELKKDIGCLSYVDYAQQLHSNILALGDVPQLPLHYVRRSAELNAVIDQVKRMKPGQYVVLHGMTGSGKSVLAVSAVRDIEILKESNITRLYFINTGEAKDQMDVANLLYKLYAKFDDKSSINLNIGFDQNGISFMKEKLKKIFIMENNHEALLILDDVCSKNIVDAFSFGCKTLITTQDVTFMPKSNTIYIEINKGFKEAESLELFSKCVNLKIDDLPQETKKIHDLCKGAPLIIALIASNLEQWKQDASSRDRWNHYINMLIDKKDGRKKSGNLSKDYLFNTIKHCVESLPKDYQKYYKRFALFVEDVNITPRVMEIVLKKSKYELEEIMTDLKNKSLIVCAYNAELKTYVYGIHDLLLAHLKQTLSHQETVQLHLELLENYLHESEHDYANLPNDNYIFTYIGYHLLEAEQFHQFPKLYFNLNFIQAKIKAVGIAAVIGDFVRYRKHITNNNNVQLSSKLDKFATFVQSYGQDLFNYPNTNIIQCGLQQPLNSEVHAAALSLAQKQCDYTLYLQTQCYGQTVYVTHTLDLKDDVCVTCFAHQTNTILIGSSSGEITLWDHSYKSKLRTFSGHTKKVFNIQVSADAKKFLSVSEDGFVKIWSLEDACIQRSDQIYTENGFNMHTPPPAIHQKSWLNFFGENMKVDRSNKTFEIADDLLSSASFSSDAKFVVAGSEKGVIKCWNVETNETVFEVKQQSHSAAVTCCTFSLNSSLILFSCENIIFIYDFKSCEYLSQFMNDVRTSSLLVVPYADTKIVAISDKSLTIWSWKQRYRENGTVYIYEPKESQVAYSENASYICGAVTWDGLYLVAGSTDHFIHMWNIETKEKVKEMLEHSGLVVSLDTFLNDESNSNIMYILLSGSDDKTVKQWHICEIETQKPKTSKLLPVYATCWMNSPVPLIAALNTEDRVQVFSGYAMISESEVIHQPKCISFSPSGDHVALGLNSGLVRIFDFRNKQYSTVMNLEGPVRYIEYLTDPNQSNEHILIASSENTCLMAYTRGESVRFKKPETEQIITKRDIALTIKCFSLFDVHKILSVEQNGSIKVWNFTCMENVLVVKDPHSTVTMAAMTPKQNMIALTFGDKHFKVYDVIINSDQMVICIFSQGKLMDDIPRSCCFSSDGTLLALGQDSGNIVLWTIENNRKLTTLTLHTSWVRHMEFSPCPKPGAPIVLVSVGDQIGWWDITHVLIKSTEDIRRNSRNRGSLRFRKPEELTIDVLSARKEFMDDCWIGKRGITDRADLLCAIKLAGVYATSIAISPNFSCFVTIDVSGLLYTMNILRPASI